MECAVMNTSQHLSGLVRSVVGAHPGEPGSLLEVLGELQERSGFLPAEVASLVAGELNLSRADVHGVVTFYSDFRSEPAGTTTMKLCRVEACRSVVAEKLVADAEQVFGVKVGQITPDGSVTLGQVFCLGNCALGPAAQINGRMYRRVDRARLVKILADGADP
jgi:formate dehydrogenase subunit gamma